MKKKAYGGKDTGRRRNYQSPGIPDKAELIQKAKQKGIPVISEIEFAARYTRAKLIGITGSNGKTTTTLLTARTTCSKMPV